jgi:SOS-response transcriptional repressor LexA
LSTLAERLKAARKSRGISQVELAKAVGIKQPTVASLESGRSANSKLLPQIAGFLRVPYLWLLSGTGDMNTINTKETLSIRMIPVLSSAQITSGNNMENLSRWLPAPTSCSSSSFAFEISGDSMTSSAGHRSYPDKTIVFVDPAVKANLDGRRVMAKVGDSLIVRTYRTDLGKAYLAPINSTYQSVEVTSDVKIIGVVIGSYLPE